MNCDRIPKAGAMMSKKIIVGATGASGLPILVRCLEMIRDAEGYESILIMSDGAKLTLECETDRKPEDVEALADEVYDIRSIGGCPASGSFKTAGMLIVPCSMKTLAGIHAGYAENLLLRAADVTIKEQRPLVLAVRESPLSPIHLRNMQELSMIPGVHIVPPMMEFYSRPESVDDMVTQAAARLLEPFGIEPPCFYRWQGIDRQRVKG